MAEQKETVGFAKGGGATGTRLNSVAAVRNEDTMTDLVMDAVDENSQYPTCSDAHPALARILAPLPPYCKSRARARGLSRRRCNHSVVTFQTHIGS